MKENSSRHEDIKNGNGFYKGKDFMFFLFGKFKLNWHNTSYKSGAFNTN